MQVSQRANTDHPTPTYLCTLSVTDRAPALLLAVLHRHLPPGNAPQQWVSLGQFGQFDLMSDYSLPRTMCHTPCRPGPQYTQAGCRNHEGYPHAFYSTALMRAAGPRSASWPARPVPSFRSCWVAANAILFLSICRLPRAHVGRSGGWVDEIKERTRLTWRFVIPFFYVPACWSAPGRAVQ